MNPVHSIRMWENGPYQCINTHLSDILDAAFWAITSSRTYLLAYTGNCIVHCNEVCICKAFMR